MNENKSKIKFFACALIVLECMIFGVAFIAVKYLLENRFPPFLLLTIRFSIGSLILLISGLIFCKSTKLTTTIGKISRLKSKELIGGGISGVILFIAFALQTVGADFTTPAKNSLFTEIFVIIVPIVNMIMLKKFSAKPLIAAAITFLGVTLVLDIFHDNSNFNVGDGLTIICGVMFAFQFIILDRFANQKQDGEKINAFNFTFIQLLVVAFLATITTLIFERNEFGSIEWTGAAIGWLCFLGICATAIAYLLQFFAQERISADLTSVLSCSDSLFALILSIIIGFDAFSWMLVCGGMLMLAGMVLAALPIDKLFRKKKTDEEE